MSRRPKNSQSVALFPFLAVLVCTMGSLIFLLLVTTRMIRDRASVQAVTELTPTAPPLLSIATPDRSIPEPPSIAIPSASEPKENPAEIRARAVAQRQSEIDALTTHWQGRLDELGSAREERARLLAQRQQLHKVASQRVATMQKELQDLEVELGKMTGEVSASAMGTGTIKERIELETQIKELKRRLRAAQQTSASNDKFEVVPFDVVSGTSRRPILIECTETGLRFIPENITVTPADLAGFTPHVNPLVVGANSLVNYWTAWNMRQPNPVREPQPYVLLLVRPSGTVAYYVAMKMLSELKQPHGYELLEEDTQLQMPPVDVGAKTACETAINRLLAERNQVLRQAGVNGFGMGRNRTGGGSGSGGAGNVSPGGDNSALAGGPRGGGSDAKRTGSTGGDSGKFELEDLMAQEDAGDRNWERVENFEGPQRGSAKANPQSTAPRGPRTGTREGTGVGAGTSSGSFAVAASKGDSPVPNAGKPAKPGTVPASGDTMEDDGIESLDGSNLAGSDGNDSKNPGAKPAPDIGLGSSGKRSIPVQDLRSRNKNSSDREAVTEPEQLAHRHWGVAEPDAAIGLEREVRIDVEATRYVIAKKHAVAIIDTDSREDTFAKIVTVLDLQARDWGKPPQGFFWKPNLRYVIAEGGDANYERVQSLLERAGLASSREYPHDQPHDAAEHAKPPVPATATSPEPAAPKPSRRIFRGILR